MAHFYSWFPGDYLRDTGHLSMIEDAAYRRLLDAYYMTERVSANAEVLLRVCRAIDEEEKAAVHKVAAEFFEIREGFLFHEKVEHEIAWGRTKSRNRSISGKKGAAVTNGKRAANAAANESAKSRLPTPSVYIEGKPSMTAAPSSPDPKEVIFDLGVSILTKTGATESGARSFLAKFAKQDEGKLAEVLGHLAAHPKVEPKAYIAGAFKPEARGLVI